MASARRSAALSEEMELHLAEKAAELQADGMTADRARTEARRRFGNVGLKHEESREIWMTRFLSELGQDVRYGFRTMIANKVFSALAKPASPGRQQAMGPRRSRGTRPLLAGQQRHAGQRNIPVRRLRGASPGQSCLFYDLWILQRTEQNRGHPWADHQRRRGICHR
jgi:hypothetical protein